MSNLKCIACNNTKTNKVDASLEGEALEMFNFVCCLEISQPEESQGICKECNDELRVSFNFKKRCLEIFANIYEHPNDPTETQNDDMEDDIIRWDSLLDQTLDEGENSLNLNDLLIPEVCFGSSALSVLDVSDNTKCRYCFTEFDTKEQCVSHMEVHKGDDKPYKCPQEGCASSFKARKNLKDHYLVHSNERPFPCHFCDQTFKSSSNRSKHERRIHSKERNAMRSANAETLQIAKLAEKVKVVEPPPKVKKEVVAAQVLNTSVSSVDGEDRMFRCEQDGCFSSFKTRSSLRDHQKVHSDERPYPCNFCSSAFKSSSNRSKHERGSHPVEYQKRKRDRENPKNGEVDESPPAPKKAKVAATQPAPKVIKPSTASAPRKTEHPCRYCDRVFSRGDRRDTHEKTHKDDRAFDCGYCSKNFKSQELLRSHTKIHTDSKLSCSFTGCDKVYQDRRALKEHESTHTTQEDYVCDEDNCGKTYTSPKALRNHKKMKHNDDENQEISCDICNCSFLRSMIAQHLLVHI